MTDPIPANQVSVQLVPQTRGVGISVDSHYHQAIEIAKQGGPTTQQYFDATNQTADFWQWMSSHATSGDNPFAPDVDPQGNPVQTASSGNVIMRMGAFYRGPDSGVASVPAAGVGGPQIPGVAADGGDPPIFGIATIQIGNTATFVSRELSFGLRLAGMPAGIVLTRALFADLLTPVYQNLKTFVVKMANHLQEAAQADTSFMNVEEIVSNPLEDASTEVESVGGDLAKQGAESLTVSWSSVALEVAGLGAAAAIPMIVSALDHRMSNSLEVHNLTSVDLAWTIDTIAGSMSVVPSPPGWAQTIPSMGYNVDTWGDSTTAQVAYALDMQLTSSGDIGSIGYVMTLVPSDGGMPMRMVVSIPWSGENVVWAGASTDDAQTVYRTYSVPGSPSFGKSSWSATVGRYKVTISITALTGNIQDQYFCGTLVVIEPAVS